MFDVSPEGANLWFDISNVVLLLGAVAVALGTYGTIKFASIKEKYSDERIAANEAQTKRAIADSDSAKEGTARATERIAELTKQAEQLRREAAEASARAAEARLELEKFKAPRTLSQERREAIISQMKSWSIIPKSGLPQSVAVFATDSSFEAANLADEIASTLGPAGAKWSLNRYPVMYGKSFTVSGVGILTSSNSRGVAVADVLVKALTDAGIFAFVIPERRQGCEEMGPPFNERGDTDPACSAISVIVGEHPR